MVMVSGDTFAEREMVREIPFLSGKLMRLVNCAVALDCLTASWDSKMFADSLVVSKDFSES